MLKSGYILVYNHSMTLTAIIMADADGGYVAQNPETGTTTQGETLAEALANLKEATELYLEEFPIHSPACHAPCGVILTKTPLSIRIL